MRALPERIDLPFGLGLAEWMPSPIERGVAWSLYAELNTQLGLLLDGTQAEDLRSARRCLDGIAAHEAMRPLGMAPLAHEMQWPARRNFLAELEHKQRELARWSDVLAKMAGVDRPEGDAPSRRRHAS